MYEIACLSDMLDFFKVYTHLFPYGNLFLLLVVGLVHFDSIVFGYLSHGLN